VEVIVAKTAADELEQKRSEKAFADADARLDAITKRRELSRRFAEKAEEAKQRAVEIQDKKEAKERKADPLYDERKAARDKAAQGATTKMVGGVKVTEYPSVGPVERRPTAQPFGGRGGGGGGGMMPDLEGLKGRRPKLYKKGGAVKSASSRADGIAQRGKTRGKIK
jgi:hypothetical protein